MCRLFGLHAGHPVDAEFWLIDAPDSLMAQSHRNPDGAGVGVLGADGQPEVSKKPTAAWQDTDFARTARHLHGTTFVAHVRYASTGAHTMANTHPFLQDGRLFAHNGVVQGLPELEGRLTELGTAGLVHGETDSERVFALITGETRRHGGDLGRGLTAAVGWIADHLPLYAVNLVLVTPADLWALRYPATHELYVLDRPAGGTAASGSEAGSALEARSGRINARSPHLQNQPSVVIASERMDDDPAWRLLEPGELLHVGPDLHIDRSTPFPAEPRHLLQASDLDATAAASQHPS
jgi:predicted glutamine amidotransferase